MQQTANFGLSQYELTDRILMEKFNSDNQKIDTALKAHGDALTAAQAVLANSGNCKIYYETYTGTGALTVTRTFPGKPIVIFISPQTGGDHAQRFIRGCTTSMCLCGSDQFSPTLTWSGNTVTWTTAQGASEVANYKNSVYHLVALLDMSAE